MYDMKSEKPYGNNPVRQSAVQSIYRRWQDAEKALDAAMDAASESEETAGLSENYGRLMNELWRAEVQTPQDVAILARAVWQVYGVDALPTSERYAEQMAEPQNVALWSLCKAAERVAGATDVETSMATDPTADALDMGEVSHRAVQLHGLIEALDEMSDRIGPRGNPLTAIIQLALPLAKSLSNDLERLS